MLFLAEEVRPEEARALKPAHSAVEVPAGGLPAPTSSCVGESAAAGWGVGTAMLQEASEAEPEGLGVASPPPSICSAPYAGRASLLSSARAVRGRLTVLGEMLAASDRPDTALDIEPAEWVGESTRLSPMPLPPKSALASCPVCPSCKCGPPEVEPSDKGSVEGISGDDASGDGGSFSSSLPPEEAPAARSLECCRGLPRGPTLTAEASERAGEAQEEGPAARALVGDLCRCAQAAAGAFPRGISPCCPSDCWLPLAGGLSGKSWKGPRGWAGCALPSSMWAPCWAVLALALLLTASTQADVW